MRSLTRNQIADQAGVDPAFVDRLVDIGVLVPGEGDTFVPGDVRRARLLDGLAASGLPVEDVAEAARRGDFLLGTFDLESYETRFASLSSKTFAQLSDETAIPLSLLFVMREAMGFARPGPDDFVREDELRVVPPIRYQLERGFNPATIERWLRVYGDSLGRMTEEEGAWWNSEIQGPIFASGEDIGRKMHEASQWGLKLAEMVEPAIHAMYTAHQEHIWSRNIFEGVEDQLERAGLRAKMTRPPAMCFLDMTGYTRLTEERGDAAAADLAASMARTVQRTSREHGGKLVKWLGDGVMFFYRDPGPGVLAALQMVESITGAGLPPAHVGIHAGPVVFQEGDYFGRTVNIAARIAAYARPGEILVSQEVVDASSVDGVTFTSIGPADLKGVSGELNLFSVRAGS